jgi:glycosyltransferase involved in cell wall biosynthesis
MVKKKIAFLGNQIDWGGGAKSLLLLLKALSHCEYDLYLYVTNIKSKAMKKEFEKYVHFVKKIKLPELVSAQTETIENNLSVIAVSNINHSPTNEFIMELVALEIDILHINNSVFSPIYNSIKIRTNIIIVSHIREWIHWNGVHDKQRYIISNIIKHSDAIICISDVESEKFLEHPNLHIISNPFDFDELDQTIFDNAGIRKQYGIGNKDIVIGMMASFQRKKGLYDFIKVLSLLKNQYRIQENIKFVAIGRKKLTLIELLVESVKRNLNIDSFKYDIHRYINNHNLADDIILIGKTPNVLKVINCFDIAVRPSYSSDPWGRDIIEYMAMKKPIVATGSSNYYVKECKTGYLVSAKDVEQMAERILWLISNRLERDKMGDNAYKRIFKKCNYETYGSRISSIYDSL